MLVKKLVVGPLRITFLFTFFWWSKHFRFAMEMLSDTVCAVPSSLTHRYCLLFLFLYQTLPIVETCVQCSSFAFCATVLSNFCQRCSFVLSHFVHYCFAWQTCSKESLEGLAEDGGTQWLHYSSGDKAQRQGNENLFTLHRLYFSSYFTTTSQVSLLELGGAGHFDSEMLTFNWEQLWRGNISDCTASTPCNKKFSNVQALTETPDKCYRKTWLLGQGKKKKIWGGKSSFNEHHDHISHDLHMCHNSWNWTYAFWVTRATWLKNSMREPLKYSCRNNNCNLLQRCPYSPA